MKTSSLMWVGLALIVIAGGWYFMSLSATDAPVAPFSSMGLKGKQTQTNTGQVSVAPVVSIVSDAKLGNYLVAANGMTLYLYTKDAPNVSNCYGDCAVKWPPYAARSIEPLVLGNGVTGKLTTITHTDGTMQYAYNTIPLYYWYLDVKPGDTLGQNVGGVWFVVKP